MFILGAIGIVAFVIGVMLLKSDGKPAPKSHKRKNKRRYADPPGWGTPHGFDLDTDN
jgi:hypothetical protein